MSDKNKIKTRRFHIRLTRRTRRKPGYKKNTKRV